MIGIKGLTRQLGDVTALDALALTVAEGKVLGFPGPNGAGKLSKIVRLPMTDIGGRRSGGGLASGGTEPRPGGLPRSGAGLPALVTNASPGQARVPLSQ